MAKEKFQDFSVVDFPNFPDEVGVYIILYIKNDAEIPLYVGETNQFRRRMGEYTSANFAAPTDFIVGEAIKYLQEKGYKMIIKYKFSENKKREQNEIIKDLQSLGYKLLNGFICYDYERAEKNKERERIKKFCENILTN